MTDCSNCAWTKNNANEINCNKLTDEGDDSGDICHPGCYKFTSAYLNGDYYNAYTDLITDNSITDRANALLLRDTFGDDIYRVDINSYSGDQPVSDFIEDSDTSECTGAALETKLQELLTPVEVDGIVGSANTNITLPRVDTDYQGDPQSDPYINFNNIIDQTISNIRTINLSVNSEGRQGGALNYELLIPDINNKNASNNLWSCSDSSDSKINNPQKYNEICNPVGPKLKDNTYLYNLIKTKCDLNISDESASNICNYINTLSETQIFKEIRATTKKFIPGIDEYISDQDNILEQEVELWYQYKTLNLMGELIEEDELTDITDLYSSVLSSDEYKSLTDIFIQNAKFRNCMDEILYTGDNDKDMIDKFKNIKLDEYTDDDYKYIEKKLDRLISIRPSDLHSCFNLINGIEQYICKGMMTISIFSVFSLVINILGMNIDLYKIKGDSPEYENLKKLIDIIVPKLPEFVKRLLDLSTFFEKKYCDGKITSTTMILEKLNNELFSNNIDIKYGLFDNYDIGFDFFDDFTKNIYGKIILLIFISFLISKLL